MVIALESPAPHGDCKLCVREDNGRKEGEAENTQGRTKKTFTQASTLS